MPPTRRKSAQTARAQPTLSFNSHAAKITKPSVSSSKASKNAKKATVLDTVSTPLTPAAEDVIDSDEKDGGEGKIEGVKGETTSELAIREQVAAEKKEAKSEAEERARGVSDAQIRRYWNGKEEGRKAPRGRWIRYAALKETER